MSSPLRTLAYRHRWFYELVTGVSALSVGGAERLRQLGAEWLADVLPPAAAVLDLCCGGGEAAIALAQRGLTVTGLDVAPRALDQARTRSSRLGLPVTWIEGLAEDPPLPAGSQSGVQISLAFHEFNAAERAAVLQACHRLLQPSGWLAIVDLHPAAGVMALPQRLFCALFETSTATDFLSRDLADELTAAGFELQRRELLAAGSLQRLLARKPADQPETASDLDALAAAIGPGGELAPEREQQAYRARMQRRQQVQRQRVGERKLEKGLVLVFTGDGKGKTTAALGLVLRTLGHGESVAVLQFIKGGWQPGEAVALQRFGDDLHWHALGEGFTWETQDRNRDRALVQAAWERSLTYLADAGRKLVVLDEVNVALKLGYLDVDQLLQGLALRPPLTHVALTGRGAPPELLERADLVTEMKLVRHPFREQGVKAQKGIEF